MQQTNVLEYLENTVGSFRDKTAFASDEEAYTFGEVYDRARAVGSFLAAEGYAHEPVVVFMRRSPSAIVSFFGVVYAGCAYVPIDEEMPAHRIGLIFDSLKPRAVITDAATAEQAETFSKGTGAKIYSFAEISETPAEEEMLADVREHQLDVDPIYLVFTSGSTGVPKGVAACHRSVIDYIENLSEVLRIDEDTVFGNQTPLYFDACLKELYPTLKFGATTWLIPHELFMFPVRLVEYLNTHRINTVCWVVSALTMISAFGAFDKVVPEYLRTVAFGSEVFPIRQFNLWKKTLPQTDFVNLYGPTEGTGMCCWYRADRLFAEDEVIPIGKPFHNTGLLLLKEDGTPAEAGEEGELYIRGTSVTLGYYNNPEKTAEAFVQNPQNPHYPETVYRTGDIVRKLEDGNLVFVSRRDHQIKHMGHRIELGEIEAVVNREEEIRTCCCLFDGDRKKIVLYYVGDIGPADLKVRLKDRLPRYMLPHVLTALDTMPHTANGKIDRNGLKAAWLQSQESRPAGRRNRKEQ